MKLFDTSLAFNITTPTLLFSAIGLMLLAYNNRFNLIATRIRDLWFRTETGELAQHAHVLSRMKEQIPVLSKRLRLVQRMQVCAMLSFILCTAALFALFWNKVLAGKILFAASVAVLFFSFIFALAEVMLSTKALKIMLQETLEIQELQALEAGRKSDKKPARKSDFSWGGTIKKITRAMRIPGGARGVPKNSAEKGAKSSSKNLNK